MIILDPEEKTKVLSGLFSNLGYDFWRRLLICVRSSTNFSHPLKANHERAVSPGEHSTIIAIELQTGIMPKTIKTKSQIKMFYIYVSL